MYLLEKDIEKNVLRQGDIINDVQYFGCINLNNVRFQVNSEGKKEAWSFKTEPVFGPAMVVSHSCELDPDNGIKITSIILCPLRDVNKATAPEKINELKQTNIITTDSEISYLKYFYLQPNQYLPYPDGAIVDFSKCFSLHNKAYELLINKKILQLTDELSKNMALKLSLYYYRNQISA